MADAAAWFAGRLPDGWFTGAPLVSTDREEILVVGELTPLGLEGLDSKDTEVENTEVKNTEVENTEVKNTDDNGAARAAAEAGRISRFREETREIRIEIAQQAEHRYGRKVAWGARLGGTEEVFTTISVPVMTRLRQPERQVLDTLVDSGVARSRSEALAWAVRLVGDHAQDWLGELRQAMQTVEEVRAKGPDAS